MTADEFVEVVRKGSDKLRVDDIALEAGEQEFHGRGVLRIGAERIEIEMTLNAGESPPELRSGIFTKRDSFRLRGVIEDRLQFRCDSVGPVGKNHAYHELQPNGVYDSLYKIIFRLHPMELIPTGL